MAAQVHEPLMDLETSVVSRGDTYKSTAGLSIASSVELLYLTELPASVWQSMVMDNDDIAFVHRI